MLAVLLPVGGCSEPASLLIEVAHPSGFDPAAVRGTLTVALERAGGELVREGKLDTRTLGSKQRLFEELDLTEGERYRLRLAIQLDPQETACADGGRRAVGWSPPFLYERDIESVSIYVDCADASSATGQLAKKRVYHTATLLQTPAPQGKVVLIGGAEPSTDLDKPESAVLLDSLERYDPATGKFTLLSGKLGRPRLLHTATSSPDGTEVTVAGGMDKVVVVSKTVLSSVTTVERVRDGLVSPLPDLTEARSYHSAADVGGSLVLVGGVGANVLNVLKNLELFDPTGKAATTVVPTIWPRILPVVIPLDEERVLISGGVRLENVDIPDELLCLSGSCACGAAPCVQKLDFGYGKGKGRYGMTGTRVDCDGGKGEGAVYIVGGNYKDTVTQAEEYYDDVFCVDVASPKALLRVGQLRRARTGHTTTLLELPGGKRRLLVAGGSAPAALLASAELLDVSCRCEAAGSITAQREVKLESQRALHTATLLADGTVLLAGGIFVGFSAERFNPDR
jgi:hypothetical protein